jgi:transposase
MGACGSDLSCRIISKTPEAEAASLPTAFRWNKPLIDLYARLIAKGKAHNAALIACARKLLIYANTVVQRGTPWVEKAA